MEKEHNPRFPRLVPVDAERLGSSQQRRQEHQVVIMDPNGISGPQKVEQHVPKIPIHRFIRRPRTPGVLVPLRALVPGRAALVQHGHVMKRGPKDSFAVVEVAFFAVRREDGDAVHLQEDGADLVLVLVRQLAPVEAAVDRPGPPRLARICYRFGRRLGDDRGPPGGRPVVLSVSHHSNRQMITHNHESRSTGRRRRLLQGHVGRLRRRHAEVVLLVELRRVRLDASHVARFSLNVVRRADRVAVVVAHASGNNHGLRGPPDGVLVGARDHLQRA
mmetsp:Transcript_16828/g.44162  ORF Transcript_16828/g.44162 Transcript_16828/m.44162 type:complete len:275 (-) Transcript_16828:289-1113(-)